MLHCHTKYLFKSNLNAYSIKHHFNHTLQLNSYRFNNVTFKLSNRFNFNKNQK